MIRRILAIQNCGPSGTTLLQSLLDGHRQILTLPGLHGQQLLVFWDRSKHLLKSELFTRFTQEFAFYFEPNAVPNDLGLRELGPNRDELACVDKIQFLNYLQAYWDEIHTMSRKEFIVSIYIAYNRALGRKIDPNSYLLYPIHSLRQQYAAHLVEDFEIVRFLHTIREPLQGMGSAAKHIDKYEHWDHLYLLSCVAAQMICDFTLHVGPHDVYGMRPYFADSPNGRIESRALKLEDIHKNLHGSLNKICNWLNLEWSDSLLHSTFNGKIWHNRPESIRQVGVGEKILSQKHSDILPTFDYRRLDYLSTPFKTHFGYPTNIPTHKKLTLKMLFLCCLPFKMELMRSRLRKQLGHLRQKKTNRRLTRWIPNFLDKPYIIIKNLTEYIQCRKKWLLPACLKSQKETEFGFVKLL